MAELVRGYRRGASGAHVMGTDWLLVEPLLNERLLSETTELQTARLTDIGDCQQVEIRRRRIDEEGASSMMDTTEKREAGWANSASRGRVGTNAWWLVR